jgi:predicted TIM-barrel fold metal-dependent hydrolase
VLIVETDPEAFCQLNYLRASPFHYLISLFGSDHVLLGTDYPYDMGNHQPVETVSRLSGITEEDRRKIMRENAVALFKLKAGSSF